MKTAIPIDAFSIDDNPFISSPTPLSLEGQRLEGSANQNLWKVEA